MALFLVLAATGGGASAPVPLSGNWLPPYAAGIDTNERQRVENRATGVMAERQLTVNVNFGPEEREMWAETKRLRPKARAKQAGRFLRASLRSRPCWCWVPQGPAVTAVQRLERGLEPGRQAAGYPRTSPF